MKSLLLLSLTLFSLGSWAQERGGGGVGNGGDGVFCTWRKPLALDFYETAAGQYSMLEDIYDYPLSVSELSIEILEMILSNTSKYVIFEDVDRKTLALLIKRVKKGVKKYSDYRKWEQVETLPNIEDSLHDIFLPAGCEVKQVAQFKDGKVRVIKELFEQLDEKQREVLAFHEALYWVGRTYYKHTSSYLTRWVFRGILQQRKGFVYKPLGDFVKNVIPDELKDLDENIPGSSEFYFWRSNVFDLYGKYSFSHGNKGLCPELVEIETHMDATFDVKIGETNNFPSKLSEKDLDPFPFSMGYWQGKGWMTKSQMDFLFLKNDDRAFWFPGDSYLPFFRIKSQG